jgi:Beta propeller domain
MTRLITCVGAALLAAAGLAACTDDRPSGHLAQTTTQLTQYDSCSALEADLKEMLIGEVDTDIERIDDPRYGGGAQAGDAGGGASPPPATPPREEGKDYSGTNNQEQGVDEADFVKTDGYHIYVINGRRLHIFGVPQFGQLVPESVTDLEGYPTQMLVDRDANRAVVFSMIDASTLPADHPLRAKLVRNEYGYSYWRIDSVSKITVLDITDRTKPTLVREVFFEGSYQTARKVGSSVRLSAYSWLEVPALWNWYSDYYNNGRDKAAARRHAHAAIDALTLGDLVPELYVRTPDGALVSESLTNSACRSFYRPSDSHARGISSIMSFDLLGPVLHVDADHVVSNWATFYSSTDTLVLTEAAHDWWWYWWYEDDPEHLNVHAFDISVPGQTRYIGSGRVEGWLFDSFSIDEEAGNIRLATTTDMFRRWWLKNPPQPDNHIWVLRADGDKLRTVGHLAGLGTGERIMSARMIGDRGYVVTYHQVDPLWTLDLSDPTAPRKVGELKVPGFSTYLHPMDNGKLLSIGVGGDDHGANWKTQISMFDVGDLAHPALDSVLPIALEDGWGWSEAQWEHKAFQYWAPKNLLAVPEGSYQQVSAGPPGSYSWKYLSRLEVINVDPAGALSLRGTIDHSPYYEEDQSHAWSYVDIRRSIFMGDYIYAISDKAITAHRVSDLQPVALAKLPGYVPGDYWWWW